MQALCVDAGIYSDEITVGQVYEIKKIHSGVLIELVDDKPRYYLVKRFKEI